MASTWSPFPVIVDESLWALAQGRLRQISAFSRRNNKRHKYLLPGLIRCPRCGSSYTGGGKERQKTLPMHPDGPQGVLDR